VKSTGPKPNPYLSQAIMEVLDNQLKANDPPETKQTHERLLGEGIPKEEARRLIGSVIAAEIYHVMKNKEPFNRDRFVRRLNGLPDTSWLDEK